MAGLEQAGLWTLESGEVAGGAEASMEIATRVTEYRQLFY